MTQILIYKNFRHILIRLTQSKYSNPNSLKQSKPRQVIRLPHSIWFPMNNDMNPNEATITLPVCLFSILAASSQLDKVDRDFIREQCGTAISAYREICGPRGDSAFKSYCEIEGVAPLSIGMKNYQEYVSAVSRPPPQSALSDCESAHNKNNARQVEWEETEAERREQERIAREKAEAEADRLDKERIANEKAEADRLEKERIAKAKADAARLERERRKKERLAAAKAAAANQYTNEACENRIVKSIELLQKRLEKNELDKDGPKFHPIEVDLPEAQNKTMVNILFNEEANDAEECIVQLGETCSNVLKILRPKRIIIGQVRESEIEKIKEDAPDIDEGAGMGSMLAVLESKDGQNNDDSITNAAKDCITLAVELKVLEKKGASPCNWFNHHSAFGHEYKAAMAKCIGLFSLMTVATNVPLVAVLDSETLSDAKVLAEGNGHEFCNEWTLGQFTLLVGAPSILGNIETETEMAMGIVCKGFVELLGDNFIEIWRQYGDKIMLPDEDGVIRFCETSPDYFQM